MSFLPIASGTRPESPGITLREEIQEGSLEEAALKAGLGSEEHGVRLSGRRLVQ